MSRISRRGFLTAGAIIAASAPYSPFLGAEPKRKLGVALLGLGGYSRGQLAPALQITQHCELRGLVTGSPGKIPNWKKQYAIADKNIYSYDTMHKLVKNDDIDVVYVVTPTSTHLKFAIKAAEAGKHVWCEKPMAMTVDECQQMIDVCKKNKVRLAIGYRLQHEPNTQTVIKWADSKPYGDIKDVIAKAGYAGGGGDPENWRFKKAMGGGALYDMGVYPINAARYATGMEPISVKARHETTRPELFSEVDETTYLDLEFPGGLVADCATSVGISFNQLRVNCKRGWYELQPMQSYSGVSGRTSDGKLLDKTITDQQAAQMDDDALAIMIGKDFLAPGEEGLKDIRVVQAALKSAQSGKKVKI